MINSESSMTERNAYVERRDAGLLGGEVITYPDAGTVEHVRKDAIRQVRSRVTHSPRFFNRWDVEEMIAAINTGRTASNE